MISPWQQNVEACESKLKYCGINILEAHKQDLSNLNASLQKHIDIRINEASNAFCVLAAKLEALSPVKTLARGYSITYSSDNKVIDSVADASCGQNILVRVKDGQLGCSVTSIERQES